MQRSVAVDLAGAEALISDEGFLRFFLPLPESLMCRLPIHAGEAAGAESIEAALSFGARRLGHGVRVIESPKLLDEIIERQIPLELCMTQQPADKGIARIDGLSSALPASQRCLGHGKYG